MKHIVFSHVYKKPKMTNGRYTHFGIRASPKEWGNDKFGRRGVSLNDSSPDSKADFSTKQISTI